MKWNRIFISGAILTLLFFGGLILFDTKKEETVSAPQEEIVLPGDKVGEMEKGNDYSSQIQIGGHELFVDIANTDEKRMRGLSGRERLGDNQGLLFIFDVSDVYGIWMEDMKFPIDIVWVDAEFFIVDIKENVSPESFPEIFYPSSPAKYVIEVPAGWIEKHGIQNGAMVNLD